MSSSDLQQVKQELIKAGLEVYRTRPSEIQVAERVRLHIMDSGIRVRVVEGYVVAFTARSQRSDFPNVDPSHLFERVRDSVGSSANGRGYEEEAFQTVDVTDPMDDAKILDVWHEITYAKTVESVDGVLEEVRWALTLEKYVSP